jgi:TetR/AcrR family transcriptional regulator, transcriptional repressor for nem operon
MAARRTTRSTRAPRPARTPEATRERLLAAAFEEIFRNGYQAASLDSILADTGLTKGALYHHFADKAALGYAVVDEVVRTLTLQRWTGPLENAKTDSLTALQNVLRNVSAESAARPELVELGCPLNNLTQEMSPLDEKFRGRLSSTFDLWTGAFADALQRGRDEGVVRSDVDPRRTADFVVASIEGAFGLAKSAKSLRILRSNLELLIDYLEGLRARGPSPSPLP